MRRRAGYAERNLALIIRTSMASFGALLLSQSRFILITPVLVWTFAPFVTFTVLYYLISLYVNVGTRGFDYAAHRDLVDEWRPARYPSLDVFLPVCGEPLAVLRNTWSHVAELLRAYPGIGHRLRPRRRRRPGAEAMARDLGFSYLVRPDRGWMKKAGNLRYGFGCSSGEFILILDADFAPRADLPAEMLPYFAADRSLGIVQSPQYFRTRGAHVLDGARRRRGPGAVLPAGQVSRDRHDGAICVGSCAIYRRRRWRPTAAPP